jgi:hypothetical protein
MLEGVKEQILAALVRRWVPIDPELLAGPLGLTDLRVGARRSGVSGGPSVLAWWAATVEPSFDPPLTVGAVHEEEWADGPGLVTIRGFVIAGPKSAVAALPADPVPDALGRLNPFRVEPAHRSEQRVLNAASGEVREVYGETRILDGLGYGLEWGTKAVSDGVLRFANPQAGWPLEFERLLFRFTHQVVAAASGPDFEAELACWARYREGIAAEPDGAPDRGSGK